MKDSSGHFNGAVFLYGLQFVCCEVIYFRKEAAELIENSLRETVKAGIKTGDLGSQSSTSDFAEELQKGSDVKAENKR
ncbi:hypothetical protein ACOTSX_01995 [Bacillus velezensis]|uniref:hypothetical protein n=1 Tax=Bacillus velezensis TaxID=492670 RepID=UPI00336A232C